MSAPQPGTPLPWRTEIDNVFAGPDNNSTYVADCAPMGGPVEGRPEQVANAAYIVRANFGMPIPIDPLFGVTDMTFVAYHIDDNRTDGVIVAIGADRDEVHAQAICRILTIAANFGSIQVQRRDDLADIADETAAALDKYFAKKGAPS